MIKFHQDFQEFLRLLEKNNVRYLLVGGYAVTYHGYPRLTMDMDIWVEISDDNAEKITKTIREFGFDTPELDKKLFMHPNSIVRMGVKPQLIEVITSVSGLDFHSCYDNRVTEEIEGIGVTFISLEDLKKNKKAAGRPKDLADLEYL